MARLRYLNVALILFFVSGAAVAQEAPTENPDAATYIQPPPAIAQALETDKNYTTLRYLSPDGDHFLVPHATELSSLELMSRTTYRLAELEIRPATDRLWHLDTYGIDGFRFFSLADRGYTDVVLADGSFASDFTWSPDGGQIAFLAHLPSHTEVWTADAATGKTRSWSRSRVLATLGTNARGQGSQPSRMLQWTPEGSIITLLVPPDRGVEPRENRVPSSPVVRRTRDKPVSTPTYPNLLKDAHDETLFQHYTTSQITEIRSNGRLRAIGSPGMYESVSLSPDGAHLLVSRIERPFSFRTSYGGFPRRTLVLNVANGQEAELNSRVLREGRGGNGDGDGGDGPRDFAWIPDGSGLAFLSKAKEDKDNPDAPRPDRVMRANAPFDLEAAETIAASEDAIRGATYSQDASLVFATASKDGETAIAFWNLSDQNPERHVLLDFHKTSDPLKLPGSLLTAESGNGLPYAVVSERAEAAYLQGAGYQADFRPRPFVDRVSLADTVATRVFEGATDSFDRLLVGLDADMTRMIVQRESISDFPDSYLVEGGSWTNLTNNVDPFPEVTAARRIDFEFGRRDGLKVQGRVSLPIDYVEGQKVPAIFWTYPREYTEASGYEHAAVRSRNKNAFTHMSWLRWSDLWLTQGYALVYPDIPIVGENYNDTYIGNLVDAMYGAIRAVDALDVVDIDRIGHGGHSYGAFATANILANSPFFKAGIAGDGAYNRSLTPAGFQSERRSIWEAPHTYIEMSPFFKADQIDTPMLMYHGGDDNNTGTFPMQSRRMIQALTEHGKTAVLYEYPYESHTPRSIENKYDMWGRFIDWFDTYVKGSDADAAPAESSDS
ncbi:MAG: dipeptidyl aminopeptidase/acylaminoacyl peptidase [Rhodothermales bacterium]|jgi:dipeptidyl aminopeptidase/acylaminoacyl peptidase